ncbi:MAG: chorismate synthase [Lachnospiraceae bacterium]|nr:chorismate synthase [Lachnospiraceae bacterium]
MAGSIYGKLFTISTWGESHGKGIGVVVDGCPAGLNICEKEIQDYLALRRPGSSAYTTPRKERDLVTILSGVFEGRTTGTPVSLIVYNEDQRSADYSRLQDTYRPGHADYTFDQKYGFRDYRGGGRSSGRETIGRVAAGAIAQKLLARLGISVRAYAAAIGPVTADPAAFDANEIRRNPFALPDAQAAVRAEAYVQECMRDHNSAGGVIECIADGLPAGLGEPVFDKLDACLGKALFSIGAVKGVEIGDGFAAARATGLTNNDSFTGSHPAAAQSTKQAGGHPAPAQNAGPAGDPPVLAKKTNHAGGVLGGISDGSRLIVRAAVKPTPSIAAPQETVNRDGQPVSLSIQGRHDPLIVPRAVVVVEAMTALTLADLLLQNLSSRMEYLEQIYKNCATPHNTRR